MTDFDQNKRGRFHVIDGDQNIVWKSDLGYKAYECAGSLAESDNGLFQVIDTRDGSLYGGYLNGEPID